MWDLVEARWCALHCCRHLCNFTYTSGGRRGGRALTGLNHSTTAVGKKDANYPLEMLCMDVFFARLSTEYLFNLCDCTAGGAGGIRL